MKESNNTEVSETGAPLSLRRGAGGEVKVLLTHPGTQYSYQLAQQLERLGILYCFATGFAVGEDNRWKRWLPARWRKKLLRRTVGISRRRLFTLPGLEWRALWRIKKGANPETVLYERNKRFQEKIPQRLIDGATVVIGFDTSSSILIERCRRAGKPFILDASIAHPLSQQRVFDQLRKRFPLWAGQLEVKPTGLIAFEQQEMASATAIVVASQFTKDTYRDHGIPGYRISVNGYGTDFSYFHSKWQSFPPQQPTETRFLFFSKLSARKGFPWLCDIWGSFHERFPNTRLVAAGYGELPAGFEIPAGVEIHGFVHPNDRLALFHAADVFVFPSFFEGFAQVIIEAMACGLPVITTTQTVGPEVIDSGNEGFCIEPGDDAALFRALEWFVQQPGSIAEMGRAARKRVENMSWEAYGERWREIILDLDLAVSTQL